MNAAQVIRALDRAMQPTRAELLLEVERLRAERDKALDEVVDLRARLKAVRDACFRAIVFDLKDRTSALINRATDLRRKHWRKP